MNKCHLNTELSSHEGTRCQFNGGKADIKLGIDVHQDFYMVVMQEGGSNPKPPQRFQKEAFLYWAAKLAGSGAQVHAVYEACGFGFGLQRNLTALGIDCYVVCPQKLDEPKFLFQKDRIDQIAAATAVASTDRSTSRWKQNQRANRKRKRSRENFNLD